MNSIEQHPESPLEVLKIDLFQEKGIQCWIKRDDLLHLPVPGSPWAFSGNKWRKLKYNLLTARAQQQSTLLSYGGAYSNHLAALAAAGSLFGFKTVGVVRGEVHESLNPTLAAAKAAGMQLHYLSRNTFKIKDHSAVQVILKQHYGKYYAIPDGGSNTLALQGCQELVSEIQRKISPDYLCVPCGTGGTAAGIISATRPGTKVLAYASLKGSFLHQNIQALLEETPKAPWDLIHDAHLGGYAKTSPELFAFMHQFHAQTGIFLDPIYTGKMFFHFFEQVKQNYFPPGSRIVLIHTGGLQGIAGFVERFGAVIPVPKTQDL